MPWWSSSPTPAAASQPAPVTAEVVAVLPKATPPTPPEPKKPAPPTTFSDLDNYSLCELQHLQANKSALDDMILEQAQVKDLVKQLEAVQLENRGKAENILSSEPRTQASSQAYADVSEALASTKASVEALAAQRDEILRKRSPEQLALLLNGEAQNADAAAEDLLRNASEAQTMDASALSQFRQQFVQQKMQKHMRLALKASLESGPA